jgi:hypothetical protein
MKVMHIALHHHHHICTSTHIFYGDAEILATLSGRRFFFAFSAFISSKSEWVFFCLGKN